MELLKHMDSLPPELKDKILKQLLNKLDDLPDELRNQLVKELLNKTDNLNLSEEQIKVRN